MLRQAGQHCVQNLLRGWTEHAVRIVPQCLACSLGLPRAGWQTRPTRAKGKGMCFATAAAGADGIQIDDSAVQRLKQLQAETPSSPILLRIEVEGGGCSGFQYKFKLDQDTAQDDSVFERDGVRVVCDSVSMDFLRGAVVEFEDSLMR
eukprot:GHRR01009956.1.p1 GENE.GHRR01009956.1~~GHRR01009956.1.p1  ORF type:complete len:148 (+),score=39.30 GHRR01009956.1:200-643(+)